MKSCGERSVVSNVGTDCNRDVADGIDGGGGDNEDKIGVGDDRSCGIGDGYREEVRDIVLVVVGLLVVVGAVVVVVVVGAGVGFGVVVGGCE